MNIQKIRALADYIEKNKRTFNMGDANYCIVGFGLKMDGQIGFYDAEEGGIGGFAARFDVDPGWTYALFSGRLHGKHSHGPAGSAALLRELANAEEAKQPKTIPIEDKSVGPIAMTVAIRTKELVPA